MDFLKLEEKLKCAGVPEKEAHKYVTLYKRGLAPEYAFENDEMPSDECFRTLSAVCGIMLKKYPTALIGLMIRYALNIPFSRTEAAKNTVEALFPERKEDIARLYEEHEEAYFLTADEAERLFELSKSRTADKDKVWRLFKYSIIIGYDDAVKRIDAADGTVE